jgi:Transcription factor WhiB
VTAPAATGTRREAVLGHLARYPDLTANELARVIGTRSSLTRLLQDMEAKAQVVSRSGRRPGQGGQVRLWRLAPPATVPPPRLAPAAEVVERRRERDRITTARRRARTRPLFAGTADLPGAACAGADPALFFPDRGDTEAEAAAVAICAGCPIRAACYARAVQNGERSGIWGGVNLESGPPARAAVAGERWQERRPPKP